MYLFPISVINIKYTAIYGVAAGLIIDFRAIELKWTEDLAVAASVAVTSWIRGFSGDLVVKHLLASYRFDVRGMRWIPVLGKTLEEGTQPTSVFVYESHQTDIWESLHRLQRWDWARSLCSLIQLLRSLFYHSSRDRNSNHVGVGHVFRP